jgi:hypothetical protein
MPDLHTIKQIALQKEHDLKLDQYRALTEALRTELNPANTAILRAQIRQAEQDLQRLEGELAIPTALPAATPKQTAMPSQTGCFAQILAILGNPATQGLVGIVSVLLAVVAIVISQQPPATPTPTVAPTVLASPTALPPTATYTETTAPSATNTILPTLTETTIPTTAAPLIITATLIPATNTPIIVTATPLPATNTPMVATSAAASSASATAVISTNTPAPAAKVYPCAANIVTNRGSSVRQLRKFSASDSTRFSIPAGTSVLVLDGITGTASDPVYPIGDANTREQIGWIGTEYLTLSSSCP